MNYSQTDEFHEKLSSAHFRMPSKEDGPKIWELIKSTKILDLNSAYSYLILCEFFSDTCVVAEEDDQIIGFVSAFRPPQKSDTIFVWQVAVHESKRGMGLGRTLLKELLQRNSCKTVNHLEATISPSNLPSQSLFKGLAKHLGCPCTISEGFSEKLFPESGHEAEQLYRIGLF